MKLQLPIVKEAWCEFGEWYLVGYVGKVNFENARSNR